MKTIKEGAYKMQAGFARPAFDGSANFMEKPRGQRRPLSLGERGLFFITALRAEILKAQRRYLT